MRRLTTVSLVVLLLLAVAPAALGVFQGLSPGRSAAAPDGELTCTVKGPPCGAGEVEVFRMSAVANAHAQTEATATYGQVVCCTGPGHLTNECTGDYATVLELSAADNAHVAQAPDPDYTTEVCLSGPNTETDCYYETEPASACDAEYTCLATISGTTNAHVANCDGVDDYGTKVCCQATCIDREGDTACDDPFNDPDDDGCADAEEAAGALFPKPGSTGAFDPDASYDFYDVPVPALPDPQPNGTRNGAIDITDVLAVLFYSGAASGGPPNGNGVSYDTIKNPHQIREGLKYDRSPSPLPNPPHEAGPPNGAIDITDVLAALAQSGLDCSGPP